MSNASSPFHPNAVRLLQYAQTTLSAPPTSSGKDCDCVHPNTIAMGLPPYCSASAGNGPLKCATNSVSNAASFCLISSPAMDAWAVDMATGSCTTVANGKQWWCYDSSKPQSCYGLWDSLANCTLALTSSGAVHSSANGTNSNGSSSANTNGPPPPLPPCGCSPNGQVIANGTSCNAATTLCYQCSSPGTVVNAGSPQTVVANGRGTSAGPCVFTCAPTGWMAAASTTPGATVAPKCWSCVAPPGSGLTMSSNGAGDVMVNDASQCRFACGATAGSYVYSSTGNVGTPACYTCAPNGAVVWTGPNSPGTCTDPNCGGGCWVCDGSGGCSVSLNGGGASSCNAAAAQCWTCGAGGVGSTPSPADAGSVPVANSSSWVSCGTSTNSQCCPNAAWCIEGDICCGVNGTDCVDGMGKRNDACCQDGYTCSTSGVCVKKSKKSWMPWIIVGGGVIVFVLVIVLVAVFAHPSPPPHIGKSQPPHPVAGHPTVTKGNGGTGGTGNNGVSMAHFERDLLSLDNTASNPVVQTRSKGGAAPNAAATKKNNDIVLVNDKKP